MPLQSTIHTFLALRLRVETTAFPAVSKGIPVLRAVMLRYLVCDEIIDEIDLSLSHIRFL